VWTRMRTENDSMPLGHDGYLKLWAMSDPVIAADFILLDEAQDTNPVVIDVLQKQPAQMIYVGDKYQQIYEWRGAVNAMEKIETDEATYLTMSFRFGPTIAEAASKLLVMLGEKHAIKGNPIVNSRIGHVSPRTILARTNASTITAIIECLDAGKKPHLVGGTDEVMEMLRGVQDLKEGKQSTVPDFFGFDNWEQVVEFAKSGEGDHLLSFVNLVQGRGERQLRWALNRTVDEERSDLIISTAHKAKGREWSTVRLMDDFLRTQPRKQKPGTAQYANGHDPAEVRLFYVALTRAKEAIDVPQSVLSFIR
jgi:superfamily I DNA/RNA helicase